MEALFRFKVGSPQVMQGLSPPQRSSSSALEAPGPPALPDHVASELKVIKDLFEANVMLGPPVATVPQTSSQAKVASNLLMVALHCGLLRQGAHHGERLIIERAGEMISRGAAMEIS